MDETQRLFKAAIVRVHKHLIKVNSSDFNTHVLAHPVENSNIHVVYVCYYSSIVCLVKVAVVYCYYQH